MRIPEFVGLRAPQGIHVTLATGVPATWSHLMWFCLTGQGPGWPLTPFLLATGVAYAFWAPWRRHSRQGSLVKLWVWAFIAVLAYGGLALAEGRPWPQTWGPQGLHVVWFAVVFVSGQLSALWSSQLASRARLFQVIEGIPSGPLLEQRVHEFQLDADFSSANAATLQASLGLLSFLAMVAVTITPYGRPFGVELAGGAFLVGAFLVSTLVRLYRREMESLVYGHRWSLRDKLVPLVWTCGIALLAAGGAAALMALGGPWMDWNFVFQSHHQALSDLSPRRPWQPPNPEPLHPSDYFGVVLVALLQILLGFPHLAWAFRTTLLVLGLLLPFALLAFLVWPLARWLLTGGRDTRGLLRRWWELLRVQWRAFWTALTRWRWTEVLSDDGPSASSSPLQWLRSWLGRPTARGRVPYPPVVNAFLRLVKWADPVTKYRQGETFHEYLDRLADCLPEHAQRLVRLRDGFDQELFGPRPLDAAGRRAFLAETRWLTTQQPSQDRGGALS